MRFVMFAKHFKDYTIPEAAAKAAHCGVDGLDWPCRAGYAVNPENVFSALPELKAALRDAGLGLPLLTGEGTLLDAAAPEAERIVAAMAENDVPFLKLGYWLWKEGMDYWDAVASIRRALGMWQALAEKHGVCICYHTHSGPYMGCNAATLHDLIQGYDPTRIGAYLDAGHLCAQGEPFGMACGIVKDHLKIVALKELRHAWIQPEGKPRMIWRPAVKRGEGFADFPLVFGSLARMGFDGFFSVHVEYEGTQEELLEGGKADVAHYRDLWADAANANG